MHDVCFVSYGLRIGIRVNDPELVPRLLSLLPPGWKPAPSSAVDHDYTLCVAGPDRTAATSTFHSLSVGPVRLASTTDLELILHHLESDLHLYVAERARRRVFVH